ncbi:MAG: hypothetical protein AB1458_14540, partial [Bacteroidota bacterium]
MNLYEGMRVLKFLSINLFMLSCGQPNELLDKSEREFRNAADTTTVYLNEGGYYTDLDSALKEPNEVIWLNLWALSSDSFPKCIFTFKNLEKLDLDNLGISFLP